MLDAWTNVFASPGKRTTGTGKGDFAITGPGWTGTLPAGVKEIKSPTQLVWIIGRTQTNGKADYAAVHAIQDGYKLTPLSAWGKPYTPPQDVPVDPKRRHEDSASGTGGGNGCGGVLQQAGGADEGQSSGAGRCADGGEDGEHRRRAGAAVSI